MASDITADASFCRLALRREGGMWVAYFAQPATMDNSVPIGSILIRSAEQNPGLKQAFIDLMCAVVGDALEEMLGQRAVWGEPTTAPQNERVGHA